MLPYFVGDGPSFVRRKRETYYVEDNKDDEENADDILEESVKSESDINIDTQKEEEEQAERFVTFHKMCRKFITIVTLLGL